MADRVFRELYGSVVFPSPKVMTPEEAPTRTNHKAYNDTPSLRLKEKKMEENTEKAIEVVKTDSPLKALVRRVAPIAIGTITGIVIGAVLTAAFGPKDESEETEDVIVLEPSE